MDDKRGIIRKLFFMMQLHYILIWHKQAIVATWQYLNNAHRQSNKLIAFSSSLTICVAILGCTVPSAANEQGLKGFHELSFAEVVH